MQSVIFLSLQISLAIQLNFTRRRLFYFTTKGYVSLTKQVNSMQSAPNVIAHLLLTSLNVFKTNLTLNIVASQ